MRKFIFIMIILTCGGVAVTYGDEPAATNSVTPVVKNSLEDEEPTEGGFFMKASKQAEAGKFEEAINQINEALKLNPKNWLGYELRGKYYMQLKKWDEAVKDFDKLIQMSPKDATAYSLRANAKQQMGDMPGAKEDFKKGKEILRSKKYIPPVHAEEVPPQSFPIPNFTAMPQQNPVGSPNNGYNGQ